MNALPDRLGASADRFEPEPLDVAETRARWRQDPVFAAADDDLGEEFATLAALVRARQAATLTQADVAARMGVTQVAIGRLESSVASPRHGPSLASLKRYAEAVGCRLRIELVPIESPMHRATARPAKSARA